MATAESLKVPHTETKRRNSLTQITAPLHNVDEEVPERENTGNSGSLKNVIDCIQISERKEYGLDAIEIHETRRRSETVKREDRRALFNPHLHKRNVGDLIIAHQSYEVKATDAIPEEPRTPPTNRSHGALNLIENES